MKSNKFFKKKLQNLRKDRNRRSGFFFCQEVKQNKERNTEAKTERNRTCETQIGKRNFAKNLPCR